MSSSYFLPSSYQSRPQPEYFHDLANKKQPDIVWQPEVYECLAKVGRATGRDTLIDIGCGTARKLIALYPEFKIVGVDFGENIERCRAAHPENTWLTADFEKTSSIPELEPHLGQATIVCSDVIEHLIDPRPILGLIRSLLNQGGVALLSTPDRAHSTGLHHAGPPINPHHTREWRMTELSALCRDQGLGVFAETLTLMHNKSPDRATILLGLCAAGTESQHSAAAAVFPEAPGFPGYWAGALIRTARTVINQLRG
jgi:SAM-dependent methyltransferase